MAYHEHVPAQPFIDWLAQRHAFYAARGHAPGTSQSTRVAHGPLDHLAQECGWPGDSGIRRLWRMRRGLLSGSRNRVKGERPTTEFPRVTVEDALHNAGVSFELMYVEYADSLAGEHARPREVLRFIDLYEPLVEEWFDPLAPREAWCEKHSARVFLDAKGECQWCAGEREFQARLNRKRPHRRHVDQRMAA